MENNKKNLPFTEVNDGNKKIRTFSADVEDGNLQWHRDREDRLVEATHETNWKIQFDNELPRPLKRVIIPEGVYHRLIKGTDDLTISITYI
jgi:hypothetical protein